MPSSDSAESPRAESPRAESPRPVVANRVAVIQYLFEHGGKLIVIPADELTVRDLDFLRRMSFRKLSDVSFGERDQLEYLEELGWIGHDDRRFGHVRRGTEDVLRSRDTVIVAMCVLRTACYRYDM